MRYMFVKQHDATDCAAACMAMICLHYKKETTITRLRDIMGTDLKGTNLIGLSKCAEELGFTSQAGALVMPSSYVVMDSEETMYVEGGGTATVGVKIGKNSFIVSMLAALGTQLTVKGITVALTAASAAIITAIELGTAGLATLYAGAVLLALNNWIIPAIAGAAVNYGINSLKGKSFKASVSCRFLPTVTFCPTI